VLHPKHAHTIILVAAPGLTRRCRNGRVAGRRRYSIDVERFSLGGRRRRRKSVCALHIYYSRCLRCALVAGGCLQFPRPRVQRHLRRRRRNTSRAACTPRAQIEKHICRAAASERARSKKSPRYFHQSDASAVRALPNTSVPH
jgi:hypothetical protein